MGDSKVYEITTRSRAVTSLAVATLILGGLRLVLSGIVIWFLLDLLMNGLEAKPRPNAGRDFGDIDLTPVLLGIFLPIMAVAGIAIASVSIVGGILLVIAGMALRRRRRFGRVLTLALGTLGGVLAALYGYTLADQLRDDTLTTPQGAVLGVGLLVHGGYCAVVYAVLLNRKNAAEFT